MQASRTLKPIDKNLFKNEQISIDIHAEKNTHSIQLSFQGEVVINLPFDPMDNSILGYIDAAQLAPLGNYASEALQHLSNTLREKLGAKEMIVCAKGVELIGFASPDKAERADRLRHASYKQLEEGLTGLVNQEAHIKSKEMLASVKVVSGAKAIKGCLGKEGSVYGKLCAFLDDHAEYTPLKMQEYKIASMKSRFHSAYCTPVAMFTENNRLIGMVRLFEMGSNYLYLSDETVDQETLPLENFSGANEEERKRNRWEFLLGFMLANCALPLLKNKKEIFIIAANGRVDMYTHFGFTTFSSDNEQEHTLAVSFTPGKTLLKDLQSEIELGNASLGQAKNITTFSSQTSSSQAQSEEELVKTIGKSRIG